MKAEKVMEKVPVTRKLKIRVNNLLERMSSLEGQVETWKGQVSKVQDENRRLETIVLDYAEKYKQMEFICQKLLKAKQTDALHQKFGPSSCNTPCRSPSPSEADLPVTAVEPYTGQQSVLSYMMSQFYTGNRASEEEQKYEAAPKKRRSNWDILVSCQRDYSNLHVSPGSVNKLYDSNSSPVADPDRQNSIERQVTEVPKNESEVVTNEPSIQTSTAATNSVLLPSQQKSSTQKSKRKRSKSLSRPRSEDPAISSKQLPTAATDQENRPEKPRSEHSYSSEEQLKNITNSVQDPDITEKSYEDLLPSTVPTDKKESVRTPQVPPSALLRQCSLCDQSFSSKKELRSHKKINHVYKMCPQCSKILSPSGTPYDDSLCSECHEATESETTADSNSDGAETETISSDILDNNMVPSQAILECPLCQKIYKTEPRMLKHLARHTRG